MSGLGVLLLILIVLALLGVLPFGGVPVAPTPVSVP
jgi:hypothetical protein